MANTKETSKNLFQRMQKVYEEVTQVAKAKKIRVGGEEYKTVSHDDVTALLHGPLAKNGIVVLPTIRNAEINKLDLVDKYGNPKINYMYQADVDVRFQNVDDKDDFWLSTCKSYAFDPSDKAPGKAISMAVKIILLKTFMLESFDEEEQRPQVEELAHPKKAPTSPVLTAGIYAGRELNSISKIELSKYHAQLVSIDSSNKFYADAQAMASVIGQYLEGAQNGK